MARAASAPERIVPVILSGGSGTRLWPLSRTAFPKQFLALAGDNALLTETAKRMAPGALFAEPVLVCNDQHRFLVAEQLRRAEIKPRAILLEPVARSTAPAVAAAALVIARTEPSALMLVAPSDHVILDQPAFQSAVRAAAKAAMEGALVTFGMKPSRAETGYGYIRFDRREVTPEVFAIAEFVEKPDAERAAAYLADGAYLWNSGMFLFRAERFLGELERFNPEMLAAVRRAVDEAKTDLDFTRLDAAAFAQSPSDSIDYAVMERTDAGAIVPADFGWSDIGSWEALWEIGARDAAQNVAVGEVIAEDARGNYLRAEPGRMIAAIGVEDLLVVATDDAVLVAPRARAQDVKKIVDRLKSEKRDIADLHRIVYRPWGSYQGVDMGERFQVKRIVVAPGQKLSMQMHHHRSEHWVVVQGTARVTRDQEEVLVFENQSIYIPIGARHRLENPGKVPLHLIEVQSGAYLGEDDIVRFDDVYGRA